MIKAIYIEDEEANIKLLDLFVKKYCNDLVELVGNASNPVDAFLMIKKIKPSLVFLDIELNDGDAFDFLELSKELDFGIIFITAYSEFAVKAFRHNAIDYLLKPMDPTLLRIATEKAVEKLEQKESDKNIIGKAEMSNLKRIGIPMGDGLVFINVAEIIYCEAKGSYTIITLTNNKTYTTTKILKDVLQILPADIFLRIHNSWVINVNFLKKYYKGKNSYMEMENGNSLPVSIRKKGEFLDLFS